MPISKHQASKIARRNLAKEVAHWRLYCSRCGKPWKKVSGLLVCSGCGHTHEPFWGMQGTKDQRPRDYGRVRPTPSYDDAQPDYTGRHRDGRYMQELDFDE